MSDCKGCTDCCKVVAIPSSSKSMESRIKQELPYWKKVSKRIAKKKNPHLIKVYEEVGEAPLLYTCRNLRETGCAIHDTTKPVCKDYPLYGASIENLIKNKVYPNTPRTEYTEHCNYIAGLIELIDTTEEDIDESDICKKETHSKQ